MHHKEGRNQYACNFKISHIQGGTTMYKLQSCSTQCYGAYIQSILNSIYPRRKCQFKVKACTTIHLIKSIGNSYSMNYNIKKIKNVSHFLSKHKFYMNMH